MVRSWAHRPTCRQSELVYDATTAEGNEARFTLVPSAGHSVYDIIDADAATTWITDRGGHETVLEGTGPTWDDIEHFLHINLVPEPSMAVLCAISFMGLAIFGWRGRK